MTACERQQLAEASQSGLQAGRRKPVIKKDPAREILTGSPTAGPGRTGELANGRFAATNIETTVAPKRRLLNVLLPVERLVKASFQKLGTAREALCCQVFCG